MVVCVLDLHLTLEWPWLGRNGYVYITVPIDATFTKLIPIVHLDMIYWCRVVICVLDLHFTLVRKKWLGIYYSTYWCCIHQTCTNCSSWHDLLMPHGGLCPLPTFHAWVTMVRKIWLSLYYIIYECYIHQTYTNCSSWHDLLMPHGGLCPWSTFNASVTKTQNGNSGGPVMVPITIIIMSSLMSNPLF